MNNRVMWVALLVAIMLLVAPLAAQDEDIPPGLTIYVVQRGENLFRIALDHGLTIDELVEMNGITNPANIYVGQRLLVPVGSVPDGQPRLHVVQAGETLRSIAELYGKSVDELAAINNLTDNEIFIGQVLSLLPAASSETTTTTSQPQNDSGIITTAQTNPAPQAQTVPFIHTVQSGETLFRIAVRYNLSVNDIAEANDIADPTRIDVGQQLIIPNFEAPELALDLPAPVTNVSIHPLLFVEGETGRIQLTTNQPITLTGTFLGRNLAVISEQNNTIHTMIIGIPIFTEAGIYPVQLTLTGNSGQLTLLNFNIQILSGGYSSQTITLPDDKVPLLADSVEQYEIDLLTTLASRINTTRYYTGPLSLPAAATMNSPFGTRRSYNGGAFDRYHNGVDFAGAPGTMVLAAAPGQVVLADTLNIRGITTVIDHGWGIFTVYAHQSAQYVQTGDIVTTGQAIGEIGSTGRATGAHLHWEVWVNGVAVNPLQWVRESIP